ncbi:MAG: tRNA preQ1(34) S-adenosylmethionine ribosyltransferase-isomerase QueA [Rhodospirillales bacterium]|nr:tRNA preQ1(34) S-adenosylmethionine ribosyltransferase-isomerase QueA [Rhodospirillales bacterium]
MDVDAFDFDLPLELIAQRPAIPRDSARLLEIGGALRDLGIRDLPTLLRSGDLLVFNDTRVIPARLIGRKTGGARVEVTLHREAGPGVWRAFARPARKLKIGDDLAFGPGFTATVTGRGEGGEVALAFPLAREALMTALLEHGAMPLPPYIKRPDGFDVRDRDDYQTLFAKRDGAVAAPTAGLHFTPALMKALGERGVRHALVTLHVGAGTFLPVRAQKVEDHRMHAEWGEITETAADAIAAARAAGGRLIAVGSTALRLLETAADAESRVLPFQGETDIFIVPGHRFKTADLLITNFHLPRSTLFMLVSAFGEIERMKAAYAHAIHAGYRFYSYGDACLIHRENAR